jgi:hypothetical protein
MIIIKKLALILTCFFSTAIMPSKNLASLLKKNHMQSFVDQVPTTDMSILQEAIHQGIKELNESTYNFWNSNDMLSNLQKCLVAEISYIESQIQNNHTYDRKALKLTVTSLLAASVLTYGTYYFYKNWTIPSRIDLDSFEKKWSTIRDRNSNDCRKDLDEACKSGQAKNFDDILKIEIAYGEKDTALCKEFHKDADKFKVYDAYHALGVYLCLASYITTGYSSYQALSLDPNRNNDSLLKYQQLLQIVILLKEVEESKK